jgi:hypothetical protein
MVQPVFDRLIRGSKTGVAIGATSKVFPSKALKKALKSVVF